MSRKLTNNIKKSKIKINKDKKYLLIDAIKLLKNITYTKFDSSIDVSLRLGVDTKKQDQMIRDMVILPHGTGKKIKILALVNPEKELIVKNSGADYVGSDEYIQKIKNGWMDFDIVVTMPSIMIKLGPLGRILGPRGLMPNPKTGTITNNPEKAIEEIKSGKINFKTDKYGIIHALVGKCSFKSEYIKNNILKLISVLKKVKPSSSKGIYFKSIYISSTMSPSIAIETKNL